MQPQPFNRNFAESFKDAQVVEDYRFRPPYPSEVFSLLEELFIDTPRTILDVGTGTGDLARHCLPFADRIDAVDFSQQMLALAKTLPHGGDPRLHWIYGRVEEVPLNPPYALITAGSSIHWPDWSLAFPRFQEMLTPNGQLVIVYRRTLPTPWEYELREIREQYSSRSNHLSINAVSELTAQGYLTIVGQRKTQPIPFQRTLDDYIAGLHSHSGLARERMGLEQALAFDEAVRKLVNQFEPGGVLTLESVAHIAWGKPEKGRQTA